MLVFLFSLILTRRIVLILLSDKGEELSKLEKVGDVETVTCNGSCQFKMERKSRVVRNSGINKIKCLNS